MVDNIPVFRWLIIICLCIPFESPSQSLTIDSATNKVSFAKIVEKDGTEEELYDFALSFLNSDISTFYVLLKQMNEEWAFERAKWGHVKHTGTSLKLGLVSEAKDKKMVKGRCMFIYGEQGECAELLAIQGDIFIRTKPGRVKIEITNLRYVHHNEGAPPRIKRINGKCDEAGSVESLLSCGLCDMSQVGTLQTAFSFGVV